MAHNHPNGDTTPSEQDIELTERFFIRCKCLGIELCDHIILTPESWGSMSSKGYFDNYELNYKFVINVKRSGTFENTALKVASSYCDRISRGMNLRSTEQVLEEQMRKIYIKYFDPII